VPQKDWPPQTEKLLQVRIITLLLEEIVEDLVVEIIILVQVPDLILVQVLDLILIRVVLLLVVEVVAVLILQLKIDIKLHISYREDLILSVDILVRMQQDLQRLVLFKLLLML
jgi:hypothetical protein